MKIAIIGYGKMGKMIEQVAHAQGHTITAIVDPLAEHAGIPISKNIAEANLNSVDVAIEFSQPASAVPNIIALAKKKIPTVTGTTGWHEHMDEVEREIKKIGQFASLGV